MAVDKINRVVKAEDTGWNSVYQDYCKVRKKNGVVEVFGESWGGLTLTQGTSDWHDLTTLPSQYRPSTTVYLLGGGINGDQTFRLRVQPNGVVGYLNPYSNLSYWMYSWVYNT